MRNNIRMPGMFMAFCMPLSDRPFGITTRATTVPPTTLNTQATGGTNQANNIAPVQQVLTGTAETQLVSGQLPTAPLSIAIPPATNLEQSPFDLYWSGSVTTTSTTNLTAKVYAGVSTTIGSNTLLGSSGAIAQNGTTGTGAVTAPFWAHARLIYDSVSGLLCGDIEFYVNKTKVASVTLSNFPTGISNLGDPVAQFSLTLQSSAGGAGTPTTINTQKFSVG